MKVLTLTIVHNDKDVLLGMKKRGFGEGLWNGFGGKVEEGETIESAALRELYEESGVVAATIEKRGILDFKFQNDGRELQVHVFGVADFTGDPQETEEMSPRWFLHDEVPFVSMWPSDALWLPLCLKKKLFRGAVTFDAPASSSHEATILTSEVCEVDSL